MFKNCDPSFLVLAGLAAVGILFSMGARLYGAIRFHRRLRSCLKRLPPGKMVPSEALCELLGIDGDRLRELTGRQTISRREAEGIIRRMLSRDYTR